MEEKASVSSFVHTTPTTPPTPVANFDLSWPDMSSEEEEQVSSPETSRGRKRVREEKAVGTTTKKLRDGWRFDPKKSFTFKIYANSRFVITQLKWWLRLKLDSVRTLATLESLEYFKDHEQTLNEIIQPLLGIVGTGIQYVEPEEEFEEENEIHEEEEIEMCSQASEQ